MGDMKFKYKRAKMIRLKKHVNKAKVLRQIKRKADDMYKGAWEGELMKKQFMFGAEMMFDKLRAELKGNEDED